jgi:molybdate transport system substrate-binding protein
MEELTVMFKKEHPGVDVDLILGSSGKLTAQIKNGAPYDLFLSANMKYPRALDSDGKSLTRPVVYAKGALVMFTVKDLDLSQGIKLAADKKIKRVAMANYRLAPYGKAAVTALKNAGILGKVEKKFVNAESITQTLQYTMTATDIGFVAKSSMFSDKLNGKNVKGKNWVDVDPKLYNPIKQGIILLKHAEGNENARKFYDFIFSDKARAVFEKYGYIL